MGLLGGVVCDPLEDLLDGGAVEYPEAEGGEDQLHLLLPAAPTALLARSVRVDLLHPSAKIHLFYFSVNKKKLGNFSGFQQLAVQSTN